MAPLDNAKHERVVQLLAKGQSQIEAYEGAGYKPNRSAASRLAEDVNICARLAELQERAAVRTEISVANITERLLAIATKGETSTEAPMLSVARASLMDAAKLNGLVIDKSEVKATVSQLTPAERKARIAELEAKRDRSGGS